MVNILELMATVEAANYVARFVPCEYASICKQEVEEKMANDDRDLIMTFVKSKPAEKGGWGTCIFVAFTEEQYEFFKKWPHRVDFIGITTGCESMP